MKQWYFWKEEGTFWFLPYVGVSWGPDRTAGVFCGWLRWVFLITWGPNRYMHTYTGRPA